MAGQSVICISKITGTFFLRAMNGFDFSIAYPLMFLILTDIQVKAICYAIGWRLRYGQAWNKQRDCQSRRRQCDRWVRRSALLLGDSGGRCSSFARRHAVRSPEQWNPARQPETLARAIGMGPFISRVEARKPTPRARRGEADAFHRPLPRNAIGDARIISQNEQRPSIGGHRVHHRGSRLPREPGSGARTFLDQARNNGSRRYEHQGPRILLDGERRARVRGAATGRLPDGRRAPFRAPGAHRKEAPDRQHQRRRPDGRADAPAGDATALRSAVLRLQLRLPRGERAPCRRHAGEGLHRGGQYLALRDRLDQLLRRDPSRGADARAFRLHRRRGRRRPAEEGR